LLLLESGNLGSSFQLRLLKF